MKLSTQINLHRHYHAKSRRLRHRRKRQSQHRKTRRVALFAVFAVYFSLVGAGLGVMNYLHALHNDLPPINEPFEAFGLTSSILDRNGTELYRLADQYFRDPLDMQELPGYVRWAFIAGEDLDFYNHIGFDPSAVARCSLYLIDNSDSFCGGSTLTQQLIKLTTLGNEVTIERKLKEIIMSLELESNYDKDEILQEYLSVVPMGSNIYGVTAGAQFYFGKDPKNLSLSEATLLAAIIQDPIFSSPTLGLPDPDTAKQKALGRQGYILDQIEQNLDFINEQHRVINDDPELDDVITAELLKQAYEQELKFRAPVFTNKKAGHFVDYVQQQLLTRPYNDGRPFTQQELALGGYTIVTTLDYKLQQIAEDKVKQAVRTGKGNYKAYNAAMLTMKPSTGEILVMVGSRNYNSKSEKCHKVRGCKFNPQVNIMTTKQSPGSSTKPFGYYNAYKKGTLYTGSLLPDVPIDVGGGYNLKNWNGTFYGISPKTTAANMLCESRNLPAIIALESVGIPQFLNTMKDFGYTTYGKRNQYGHSVILGGADVIGVEHAQAYAVFANGGDFVQHEVVKKIIDKDGNVIYEHKPEKQKIADRKAIHMVNKSIQNCFQSSWDGRHVASKTGTSQDNADAWTVMYSPDFVSVGWMGNNNNDSMSRNAFGVTAVMPWLKQYMQQVGESKYFRAKSKFKRPPGLKNDGGNVVKGLLYGYKPGLVYSNRNPRVEGFARTKSVCSDQQYALSRGVDKKKGKSISKSFYYYKMPVSYWQKYLDAYLSKKTKVPNGGPVIYCNKPRSA